MRFFRTVSSTAIGFFPIHRVKIMTTFGGNGTTTKEGRIKDNLTEKIRKTTHNVMVARWPGKVLCHVIMQACTQKLLIRVVEAFHGSLKEHKLIYHTISSAWCGIFRGEKKNEKPLALMVC